MKRLPVILLILLMVGGMVGFASASQPITIERQPADPYDQLMELQRMDHSGRTSLVVAVVLSFILIGVGWYAISERTTKTLRAMKGLRQKKRRATRPHPQMAQLAPPSPIASIESFGESP